MHKLIAQKKPMPQTTLEKVIAAIQAADHNSKDTVRQIRVSLSQEERSQLLSFYTCRIAQGGSAERIMIMDPVSRRIKFTVINDHSDSCCCVS